MCLAQEATLVYTSDRFLIFFWVDWRDHTNYKNVFFIVSELRCLCVCVVMCVGVWAWGCASVSGGFVRRQMRSVSSLEWSVRFISSAWICIVLSFLLLFDIVVVCACE